MGVSRSTHRGARATKDHRGRPWKARRSVLNGILWVLRAGEPRADLPGHYHSYQTCHRRFQQWVLSGVMKGVVQALAEQLREAGDLDVGVQIEARSVLQSDEHQIRDAVLAYFFRPSGWITYRLAFVSPARETPVNPPYRKVSRPAGLGLTKARTVLALRVSGIMSLKIRSSRPA